MLGLERGGRHFWSHSAIQQNVYLKSPCSRHLSSARPLQDQQGCAGSSGPLPKLEVLLPTPPPPPQFQSLNGPLLCHGESQSSRSLGPCRQHREGPAQRAELPLSAILGWTQRDGQFFQSVVSCWGVLGALPGTTLGVRRPLSSLGAERL